MCGVHCAFDCTTHWTTSVHHPPEVAKLRQGSSLTAWLIGPAKASLRCKKRSSWHCMLAGANIVLLPRC